MNTGTFLSPKSLLVALIAGTACLVSYPGSMAPESAAAHAVEAISDTQDIVTMRDGRVLVGQIVEETGDQIVFLYVDPNIRIQSRLTLNKADIADIERDVPADTGRAQEPESARSDDGRQESPDLPAAAPRERGLAEGDSDDESLPALYVIPMKGQMGTDINPEAYRQIIADIREQQPDRVIWLLDCKDTDDLLIPMNPQQEQGLLNLIAEYRELVRLLHDELRGIDQVVWVHDSFGISSVIALAWPEMYMTPNARLAGMVWFRILAGAGGDQDYLAKMREAWLGIGNGFLERGRRSLQLGLAMMDPERLLSASWRGREVIWRNDLNGEYIVNSTDRAPATFRAKHAEDFGISKGTAETLDDLAMLLGYREYRVIEGDAQRIINSYVDNWRRTFQNTLTWWRDHEQHLDWAQGDRQLMFLGRARADLDRIVQAMNRYRAVEIRFTMETGMTKFALTTMIERLNERIVALREAERRRNRGGGRR